MGTGKSGLFHGTRGEKVSSYYASIIQSLPKCPDDLVIHGWIETSVEKAVNAGHRTFSDSVSGLTVRFDKAKPGKPGNRGKDHYHVENPNRTGQDDWYLDKDGNPVPDGSGPSHIFPKDN